jgi:hypothetical protein
VIWCVSAVVPDSFCCRWLEMITIWAQPADEPGCSITSSIRGGDHPRCRGLLAEDEKTGPSGSGAWPPGKIIYIRMITKKKTNAHRGDGGRLQAWTCSRVILGKLAASMGVDWDMNRDVWDRMRVQLTSTVQHHRITVAFLHYCMRQNRRLLSHRILQLVRFWNDSRIHT